MYFADDNIQKFYQIFFEISTFLTIVHGISDEKYAAKCNMSSIVLEIGGICFNTFFSKIYKLGKMKPLLSGKTNGHTQSVKTHP